MRDVWTRATLGEVATWYSGGTPRAGDRGYYGGAIPWAVIADLNDGRLTGTASTITDEGLRVIGGRTAPVGAVLVSMYGTIGRVGVAGVPMATNQAIAWAVPDDRCISTEFLFHYLRFAAPLLDAQGRGATQRNINREILKNWPILVPPLDEQRRIVDLIASVDRCINVAEAVAQRAYSVARAVIDDIASTTDQRLPLKKLAEVKGGKRLPKATPWAEYPTKHPYIRVTDLHDGQIEESGLVFVPDDVWPRISRYLVKSGDVILSIVGTIGEVAHVPPSLDGANLTENAARVRVSNTVYAPFLAAFLRSNTGQAEITRLTVGTTQKKLALFRIELIEVPVPPHEVQVCMASVHGALETLALAAEAERLALMEARLMLLTTLLSGDHEVPATYDALLRAS
jgi:restriction endonuclease S subunit